MTFRPARPTALRFARTLRPAPNPQWSIIDCTPGWGWGPNAMLGAC